MGSYIAVNEIFIFLLKRKKMVMRDETFLMTNIRDKECP